MDLDFDMLDDLGTNQPQPPSKPTRFQPKTSKFKPKTTKQEPTTLIVNNQEDSKPVISVTVNPIVVEEKPQGLKCMEVEQLKEEDLMEEDTVVEEEDTVVREIDVYFNPSPFDANTELYVMQYPLRPSWRPYDLDSRCEEVRIKPKSCEVEIDLSLDTDNNFNKDKDGKNWATKQTLSSWKSPPTTGYAIGLLKGNKLYVNPVRAVLQLRPSMKHLIAEDKFEEKLEGSSKKQVQGKPLKIPIESDIPEDEPWVSLKYHGVDSDFSSKYRQQMALEDSSTLEFSMSEYDYINSLCPKSTMEKGKGRVSDRRGREI
ncbi:hypothetical protein GIB67_017456 [Kingdonia uniflora]|uniref:Uncharacterized protein n=1 Tax=Kingdonia uniflora TaxID=39325 RepID=A0A7J7M4C8_9MAGN|nr:hypothetical protein GIB67_017456 [Kingdonia uniflora]